MQLGVDDLDTGQTRLGLDVNGDTATIVRNGNRRVRVQYDRDLVAVSSQRLINGVVDDLPQAVHEAPRVRGADVHSRSLTDRLKPLKD